MCKANWDGFSKELKGKLVFFFFHISFIGVSFSFLRNRADDTYDETVDGWCYDLCLFFNVRCVYVWETMGAFTGVNGVNIKSVGVFLFC